SELIPLKVRSLVGLTPLFAVSVIMPEEIEKLHDFKRRLNWFTNYRKTNNKYLPEERQSNNDTMLLSLVHEKRLVKLLERLLDENEFLSAGGIRAMSKVYGEQPYAMAILDMDYRVMYDPGDSTSDLFGGNSNWRGPVWMPINYLFIKALEKYGNFYGDSVKVAFPTGSGNYITLTEVAKKLAERLLSIFQAQNDNTPVFGEYNAFYQRPENKDLIVFHEYFHGDTLKGLGASHQTGWTALIADLICAVTSH
ncbi:MAG: glucosidase, partial [Ginsengibacter sp.]